MTTAARGTHLKESPVTTALRSQRRFIRGATLLFLCIAVVTVPKIYPRLAGLFDKAEARHSVWRNRVEKQSGHPSAPIASDKAITPTQGLLIVAGATVGGGLMLLALAYLALRPSVVSAQAMRDETVLESSENVVS